MTGIIDIGSASVRLLLNGKKNSVMTKLGEGVASTGVLSTEAMDRTVVQVRAFVKECERAGVPAHAFATEAVRAARNGNEFVLKVKNSAGIDVEVVSPEEEAAIAFLGACKEGTGAVIDIGGASTELVSGTDGRITYAKSIPVGAVRLTDTGKGNPEIIRKIAAEKARGYGNVNLPGKLYGVGGTLTSLAAMSLRLSVYDSSKVHGCVLTAETVKKIEDEIIDSSPEEITRIFPFMPPLRASIIKAGCIFAGELFPALNISEITVSESDNLEGFGILKGLL